MGPDAAHRAQWKNHRQHSNHIRLLGTDLHRRASGTCDYMDRKRQRRFHRSFHLSRVRRGTHQSLRRKCNTAYPESLTPRDWPFCPRAIRMTSNGSSRTPIFQFARTLEWDCSHPWCISPRQPRDRPLRVEVWFRLPGQLQPNKGCARLTSKSQPMEARPFI